jgi:hypothetical protein
MNVRFKYNTNFIAAVYYNEEVRMTNYELCLNMITGTADMEEHNIALERLKYFIQVELESTIFINNTNEDFLILMSTHLPSCAAAEIDRVALHNRLAGLLMAYCHDGSKREKCQRLVQRSMIGTHRQSCQLNNFCVYALACFNKITKK